MPQFIQGVTPLARSWPRTPHDEVPIPGGRKVGDVPTDELIRLFHRLEIQGVSAEQGRAANVAHFAKHVHHIREQAADDAVSRWLAGAPK